MSVWVEKKNTEEEGGEPPERVADADLSGAPHEKGDGECGDESAGESEEEGRTDLLE